MEQRPKYLKEAQVSEITGLALSTLRNMRFMRRGIPYSKFGRAVRYSLQDVETYLEKHRICIED